MRTNANNPEWQQPVEVFRFIEAKVNKHSTIYAMVDIPIKTTFVTPVVRIEKFQGYSKAYNLAEYFRIKDQSSWAKSRQVTGLWKTSTQGVYYGDNRENMSDPKTLLMFQFDTSDGAFILYVYPKGYYPAKSTIEKIAAAL